VLLAAFTTIEVRSDHPMLPLSLFRNRRLAGAASTLLALFFALSGAVFLTTQIYQVVLGYSPLAAGLRALPPAVTLAIAAAAGAHLAKRAGPRVPVVGGLVLVTMGLGFFATATAASSYAHYVIAMVLVSTGIGLAMSAATTLTMEQLPPALAGVGSAVNDATRNMGSVLGVAVVGSVSTSAFASRLAGRHLPSASLGQAVAAAHHAGGHSADLVHAIAGAFVTGADDGVLAAAAVALAGIAIAFVTLRQPGRREQA